MAVPAGLEPATFGLGNRCSIRLSYGTDQENVYFKIRPFERAGRFEVTPGPERIAIADNKKVLILSSRDYGETLREFVLGIAPIVVKFESEDFQIATKMRQHGKPTE